MSKDTYETAAGKSNFSDAITDIVEAARLHPVWRELVRRDLYLKTNGARLGRWWIVIGQAIGIGGMGLVYAELFRADIRDYLPYLATSIITWGLILALINEASNIFVLAKGYLTQSYLPPSLFVFRYVARNIAIFAYKVPIIIIAVVALDQPLTWAAPLALLGVAFISIAGFFTGIILGILNARYRDIGQFVTSLTMFLFFITPVFWKADRVGKFAWVVDYNPLYHFLTLVRAPLLGDPIAPWSYVMTIGTIAVLILISAIVYKRLGHDVIYWL